MDIVGPDGIAHQRNSNGTFGKGNQFAKGKDRKAIITRVRNAVIDEVSPDEMAMIIRAQANKALNGDLKAAVFLRDTILGRPQRAEPDNADEKRLIDLRDLMRITVSGN